MARKSDERILPITRVVSAIDRDGTDATGDAACDFLVFGVFFSLADIRCCVIPACRGALEDWQALRREGVKERVA